MSPYPSPPEDFFCHRSLTTAALRMRCKTGAIRNKRRLSKRIARDPTDENLRNKNKWRNVATRLRWTAIREYWRKKTKEMNSNPKEFYKVFNPFLHTKKQKNQNNEIHLNVNGMSRKIRGTSPTTLPNTSQELTTEPTEQHLVDNSISAALAGKKLQTPSKIWIPTRAQDKTKHHPGS